MKIKYAGPHPIISHKAVDFELAKEDKYVYLNIALQLLKSLDHDYFDNKTYVYHAQTRRLSSDEMMNGLKKYCPDLEQIIQTAQKHAEDSIVEQLERAQNNEVLNDEDKAVLIKNIKLMQDYIIQREINKEVYYCAVHALADMVKKDHIDHIIVPMFQKFAHVLHSVQGVLKEQKFPIDTNLEIYHENGELLARLQVINILDEIQ